jgi:hypothetical protein
MCIWFRIWALRPWNTKFWSVFAANWHFSVKLKANTFGFWAKIWNFLKPVKTYIWGHYLYLIPNLGCMTKKYRVWSVFATNWCFSVKPKVKPFWFWAKIWFFLNYKILYTGLLCVSDLEFWLYNQEIWSFSQFLPQTGVFL